MTIKIYKIDASPPVRGVLMTAEILKLNYEPQEVNLMLEEQLTPEYVAKNPLHTVPLLEDGDFLLADSHAISTYLISKYGGEEHSELYPKELTVRATVDQRLYFDTSILFPAIKSSVRTGITEGIKALSQQQVDDVNAGYDILDKYLQKTKFVAADHLTVADLSIVASISTLDTLVPVDDKYTKVNAWWNSLKGEDWYQKRNVPGLTQIKAFYKP